VGREIHRLSSTGLKAKAPGYHADGGNLYFRVSGTGTRGWIFRFALNGRTRDAGLGPYPEVGLADARAKAFEFRQFVVAGIDPIEQRNGDLAAARVESAKTITFDDCRAAYIAAHEAAWKNAKHRQQWTNTLQTYATPVFGKLPVSAIDTGLVVRAIEPIWTTKPETAGRVRGRIEAVLDWAKVRGYRAGENPARWKGHLDHVLPAKSKVRKVRHHPALPYNQVGTFMEDLRSRQGIAARALELAILCAVRTGDIIGNDRDDKPPMTWPQVDLGARVWTIPSTKTDTEHRVPLSAAAVAVLNEMKEIATGDIVFPGMKAGQPLSNMAMLNVIGRMNGGGPHYVDPKQNNAEVTPHGFRSSFRDWAAEQTSFPHDIVEMVLAHTIDSKVEAAYRRGDMLEKRRKVMDAWAAYCTKVQTDAGKAVGLARARPPR